MDDGEGKKKWWSMSLLRSGLPTSESPTSATALVAPLERTVPKP